MKDAMKNSMIPFNAMLPRIVVQGGKVGHVVVDPRNLWDLAHNGDWVRTTACHGADSHTIGRGGYRWKEARWATPEDPTCRKCLRSLHFVTNHESTP